LMIIDRKGSVRERWGRTTLEREQRERRVMV
jgi:hypothetical protein